MPADAARRRDRLAGHVAIVTGGSGGIGRPIAEALAREGASVVLVGRRQARVDAAVEAVRKAGDDRGVLGLALDVRSESDMAAMARQALERFGRIDILVASAGLGGPSGRRPGLPLALHQLSPEAWDEVVDTNLRGVFLSNRAVLPTMLAGRSGQILNISSARGALAGQPYAAAYCASKFGVMGLSEALAEEVRSFGIRVQVLLPDAVDTPLLHGTTLAAGPGDALPGDVVADFVVTMLTLPSSAILVNPLIAPWRSRRARRRSVPAGSDAAADLGR